jgi:hypothetical protein
MNKCIVLYSKKRLNIANHEKDPFGYSVSFPPTEGLRLILLILPVRLIAVVLR